MLLYLHLMLTFLQTAALWEAREAPNGLQDLTGGKGQQDSSQPERPQLLLPLQTARQRL